MEGCGYSGLVSDDGVGHAVGDYLNGHTPFDTLAGSQLADLDGDFVDRHSNCLFLLYLLFIFLYERDVFFFLPLVSPKRAVYDGT